MKFGKLYDISDVDFTLPEDHLTTSGVLEKAKPSQGSPQIYLGATGWGNREWIGKWYPSRTPPRDFLRHYSRQFGSLEFNSTHYRIPTADQVQKWYDQAQSGFFFCPKVPQVISHYQRLAAPPDLTQEFTDNIRGLLEKLGPIFLQLPENFDRRGTRDVLRYLDEWPSDLPLYFEFRHPDFFHPSDEAELVWDRLTQAGHGAVVTDVAGRRDVLHTRLPSPHLVLRFVGNALHPTDYTRAKAWVQRLRQWVDQGLHTAHIFVHQPEMDMVPEYTQFWAHEIQQQLGIKVINPQLVEEARQGKLF